MIRPRPRRLRRQSINRMIPNILTMLALCAGLTALRFGIEERFQPAVLALLAAAVFDSLDGRIARLLRESSRFGAELDSLSDFLAFGVVPAMLLYHWTLHAAGPAGWGLALLYAACCALRLARFNTDIEPPEPPAPWAKNYFTGVPSPAGAGLVLLPLIMSFLGADFFQQPWVVAVFILGVSALMVSRVPTYSFKQIRVPQQYALFALLAVALLAAFIVSAPWLTLTGVLLAYLASLPLSWRSFRELQRSGTPEPPAESEE